MSQPKTATKSFQQGNVLGRRVDEQVILPEAKKLANGERTEIMHGESGHSHVVTDDPGAVFYQVGQKLLLKLTKTATLVHEEHKPIILEGPGVWEIGRVRLDPTKPKRLTPLQLGNLIHKHLEQSILAPSAKRKGTPIVLTSERSTRK